MNLTQKLFHQFSFLVYQTGIQILHSREDAEDLVQDVFVEVLPKLQSQYGELPAEEWGRLLRRCAKNLAIDRYRQVKRRRELDEIFQTDAVQGSRELEMKIDTERLLNMLHESEKEVLTLRHYFGFAWSEVAKHMGMSEIGARKKANRAKEQLQKKERDSK